MFHFLNKLKFAELFCVYAFTFVMGFFQYVVWKSFNSDVKLSTEVNQIMIALIGVLGSVVGYVIGSSRGSAEKDRALVNAITNNSNNVTERRNDKIYKLIDSIRDIDTLNTLSATYQSEIASDEVLRNYLEKTITNLK